MQVRNPKVSFPTESAGIPDVRYSLSPNGHFAARILQQAGPARDAAKPPFVVPVVRGGDLHEVSALGQAGQCDGAGIKLAGGEHLGEARWRRPSRRSPPGR
jgi:hypothetical protein